MLKIDITACPDTDLIGEHISFFEKTSFGKHTRNDFIIKSDNYPDQALSIICHPQGVIIKSQGLESFQSNGKKVKGEKIHRVGDQISFLDTTFSIASYDYQTILQSNSKDELLSKLKNIDGPQGELASKFIQAWENKES